MKEPLFSYHEHTCDPSHEKKDTRIKTGECETRVVRIVVPLREDQTEVLGFHRVGYADQLRAYFGLGPLPRARIY